MAMFKLVCGDVMPGCSARFQDSDRDTLLAQVVAHAASHHGVRQISPEILAAVESSIHAA